MDYSTLTQTLEKRLNLTGVSQEMKEEVFIHVGDTIIERTMLIIAETLSEEEARLAGKQLEEGDIEAFLLMLNHNHPELEQVIVTTTNEVIEELAALYK